MQTPLRAPPSTPMTPQMYIESFFECTARKPDAPKPDSVFSPFAGFSFPGSISFPGSTVDAGLGADDVGVGRLTLRKQLRDVRAERDEIMELLLITRAERDQARTDAAVATAKLEASRTETAAAEARANAAHETLREHRHRETVAAEEAAHWQQVARWQKVAARWKQVANEATDKISELDATTPEDADADDEESPPVTQRPKALRPAVAVGLPATAHESPPSSCEGGVESERPADAVGSPATAHESPPWSRAGGIESEAEVSARRESTTSQREWLEKQVSAIEDDPADEVDDAILEQISARSRLEPRHSSGRLSSSGRLLSGREDAKGEGEERRSPRLSRGVSSFSGDDT